jgi:hypothetical protein
MREVGSVAGWYVGRFLSGPVPAAEPALTDKKRARHSTATVSSTVITKRPLEPGTPESQKTTNKPEKINHLATKT